MKSIVLITVIVILFRFQQVASIHYDNDIDYNEDEHIKYMVERGLFTTGCNCGGRCVIRPGSDQRICVCDRGQGMNFDSHPFQCKDCHCGTGEVSCWIRSYNSKICYCEIGYRGGDGECTEIFDVCVPNPCYNDGICKRGLENYICDCPGTLTGPRCNIGKTCNDNPCKNGGTCWERKDSTNNQTSYICTCSSNHTGKNCEEDSNACDSNPCKNGGLCWKGIGSKYLCICPKTHSGENCELAIDPCDSVPCLNGGTCWKGEGVNYICSCPSTHIGFHCETEIHICDSSPCQNGGTCWSRNETEYVCSCPETYQGIICETEIDPCESVPCENGGTCWRENGLNYTCVCSPNYKGKDCEIVNDNRCDPNPCSNGGSCSEVHGTDGYKCSCTKWYTGKNCTDDWWCELGIGKHLCQKGDCHFDHENQIGFCNNYIHINERKFMGIETGKMTEIEP